MEGSVALDGVNNFVVGHVVNADTHSENVDGARLASVGKILDEDGSRRTVTTVLFVQKVVDHTAVVVRGSLEDQLEVAVVATLETHGLGGLEAEKPGLLIEGDLGRDVAKRNSEARRRDLVEITPRKIRLVFELAELVDRYLQVALRRR